MTHYFDPEQTDSLACFASLLESMLKKHTSFHDLVLLCIGSDRATGDSLGPLLGHRLQQGRLLEKNGFHLYGTLEHPVHAKNLEATIRHIQFYHSAPLIIALDASLGRQEHIGYVTLRKGPLFPGVGVAKNLPPVGDISHYRHRKLRRLQTPAAAADHVSEPSSRTGRLHPEWVISQPGLITAPSAPPMRGIRSSHQ